MNISKVSFKFSDSRLIPFDHLKDTVTTIRSWGWIEVLTRGNESGHIPTELFLRAVDIKTGRLLWSGPWEKRLSKRERERAIYKWQRVSMGKQQSVN